MSKEVKYYKTYEEDFVTSKDQNYKLPEDYIWIKNKKLYKIWSAILYFFAYIFSIFYCKFGLHVKVKNRKILKKYQKQGYFIYGNHTQPIGDAFLPAYICKTKRTYVVAGAANLKVKFIGRLLPILGILPIPSSSHKMKELIKAVKQRINEKKCVVIYPEAHVWPYYTKIRPFSPSAFKFPVENNSVSFSITTTYQKRKIGKKPKITVYVDGPFEIDNSLKRKEKQEKLGNQIYEKMQERSKESTYNYIEYKKIN